MSLRRMKLKICVVGERAVGKTSLLQRYVRNHFSPDYDGTLGAYLYPVDVEVKSESGEIVQAKVALFDLMGEHSIRETFRDAMFYGTHGVLAVCDIERPDTLYAVADWVRAVSLVTGGVPFHIAFNKVDRASNTVIGATETQWLREQFPLTPTTLTSALTGEGVEAAIGGIIERSVEEILAVGRRRQVKRLVRQKILAFVVRRGLAGVSKNDLLVNFKELDYGELMEEVENLARLDVLAREESGPNSFRIKATKRGQEIAASTLWEELVVDEHV
jgi:small GTP-binding protein